MFYAQSTGAVISGRGFILINSQTAVSHSMFCPWLPYLLLSWKPPNRISWFLKATILCPLRADGPDFPELLQKNSSPVKDTSLTHWPHTLHEANSWSMVVSLWRADRADTPDYVPSAAVWLNPYLLSYDHEWHKNNLAVVSHLLCLKLSKVFGIVHQYFSGLSQPKCLKLKNLCLSVSPVLTSPDPER